MSKQLNYLSTTTDLLQRLYYFGIEFAGAGAEAAGAAGAAGAVAGAAAGAAGAAGSALSITPPLTLLVWWVVM